MSVVNKLKSEQRPIIAIIALIAFFLPWVSAEVTSDYGDMPITAETGMTAFAMLKESGVMVILLLIPVGIIIFGLTDVMKIKARKGLIYLAVAVISILGHFYFVSLVMQANLDIQTEGYGSEYNFDIKIHRLYGFWISLASYVAIIVMTLIKDYYLTRDKLNKEGVGSVLEGIKKDIATTDLSGVSKVVSNLSTQVSQGAKNGQAKSQIKCTSCEALVTAGKQFCENCGARLVVPEQKIHQCQECGFELQEDYQYCPKCGVEYTEPEPQEPKCAQCGYLFSEDHQFCPKCGKSRS